MTPPLRCACSKCDAVAPADVAAEHPEDDAWYCPDCFDFSLDPVTGRHLCGEHDVPAIAWGPTITPKRWTGQAPYQIGTDADGRIWCTRAVWGRWTVAFPLDFIGRYRVDDIPETWERPSDHSLGSEGLEARVREELLSGESPSDIALRHGLATTGPSGAACVLLPGWIVGDGTGRSEPTLQLTGSCREAARLHVEALDASQDGAERTETEWVSVRTWARGLYLDGEEVIASQCHSAWHTIPLDPPEPPCSDEWRAHDWKSAGHMTKGGGIVATVECRRCDLLRTVDTSEELSHGKTSVRYHREDS